MPPALPGSPQSAPTSVSDVAVREQLARILDSEGFRRAGRSSALLRYVVERTLAGEGDRLKEYTLGLEALRRPGAFDPRTDPIVRAEASRLRDRLDRYYETAGRGDPVLIALPKGSYVPQFVARVTAAGSGTEPAPGGVEPIGEGAPIAGAAGAGAPHRPRPIRRLAPVAGIIAIILSIAAAGWLASRATLSEDPPLTQFEVELKVAGTLGSEVGPDVALSSDGTQLVFVARDDAGRAHLYTRLLSEPVARRLPGTDGARVPFLSPDGRWVGFWADGKVKRTPIGGGSPTVLCDATDLLGASWGEDGFIVGAINPTGKLWRIPESGGPPEAIGVLEATSSPPLWPQLLPGGRAVVYTGHAPGGADQGTIEVLTLPAGARKVLVRGGSYGRYLANGYLTYVNQGTVYAVPFDVERLEIRGTPVPVLDDVAYSRTFGYAQLDVSRSGTAVYRRSAGSGTFVVSRLGRDGVAEPVMDAPGRYNWVRLSPDGSRAAFNSAESGASGLVVADARDGTRRRLEHTGMASGLVWLQDGSRLIVGGRGGMHWIDVDQPGAPRGLTGGVFIQVPWSLAPGGRRLAWHEMSPATGFDLWTAALTESDSGPVLGIPEAFVRTPAFEVYPAFSPDGRWIAYSSNHSGTYEVYVRPFPDRGEAPVRVSTRGGRVPLWSPNGRELLYQTDEQRVMVVSYRATAGTFTSGAPVAWSPEPLGDTGVLPGFDVAGGGEHIVGLFPSTPASERQSPNHVTVMLNFLAEVARRAGRGAGR